MTERLTAGVAGALSDVSLGRPPADASTSNPRPIRYDVLGVALPGLLWLVAVGVAALAWGLRGDWGRGASAAVAVAFYGGLSVLFGYVPYLTGYVGFRMAALASNTRTVLHIAVWTLAAVIVVGAGFGIAQALPLAITALLVIGIPSLAGVIACLAQTAARRDRESPAISA